MMANLFPMSVRLEMRDCLLVGAGKTAAQKVESLLSAGARVHVVAPHAVENIRTMSAAGELRWSERDFNASDLAGVFLVVAATNNRDLNQDIFREARLRGVMCNAVDDPDHCDFFYPAVVRRGDLQVAISTSGHSPALAQRLRKQLEQDFGEEYAEWVASLGEFRRRLFQARVDPEERRRVLHQVASQEAFEQFLRARRPKRGSR
jgi:precorrin-2 dehydrogenase/sirohydrochlorin ferrochelatase